MAVISFVLPIYNTPLELLKICIEKIIISASIDIEIILVDDGSKYEIAKACDDYAKIDSRVKVYHQKNQGVSVARNYGIKKSCGNYIIFVDPDDYVLDEIFDIDFFKTQLSDVILFNYIRKTKNGSEKIVSINKGKTDPINRIELIKNTLFCANDYGEYYAGAIWAKAFRREFLINNNIFFDTKLRKSQDRVFMLYIYKYAYKISIENKLTYVYYENMKSICNTYKPGAAERSELFANAVEVFLEKDNYLNVSLKQKLIAKTYFVVYFEMLYLDIFNKDNRSSYRDKKSVALERYNIMKMNKKMEKISYKECSGLGEKMKVLLIKKKCFLLLDIVISYRQLKRV